jgi:hypothetical protein
MLADDATSLEDECNEIALKNDVAINIGFGESSIGFSQAAISSFACSKISCLNSYFEKNDKIDDNSYCCVHVCDSKINEFCKNGAKCLADIPNEYEPKCAWVFLKIYLIEFRLNYEFILFRCRQIDINNWGIIENYSGSKCENTHKSISKNLFITLISSCGVMILIIIFINVKIRKQHTKKHEKQHKKFETKFKNHYESDEDSMNTEEPYVQQNNKQQLKSMYVQF